MFDLRLESECLLLTIDVELDFSGSHINVSIRRAQERPPQDERGPGVDFHVENDEIDKDEEILYFHRNVLRDPRGIVDRLIR